MPSNLNSPGKRLHQDTFNEENSGVGSIEKGCETQT